MNKKNGFEYVDLGLPSNIMWATCNVGADTPENSGLLFQFGRVDGYAYNDNDNKFISNYQNEKDTGSEYIPKTTSGKIYKTNEILDLADDAAHVNMGGKWRMPTSNELEELLDNTAYDVETINGVKGVLFISNINNKRLFVPFIGYWHDDYNYNTWLVASIRSSQVNASDVDCAYNLYCYSSGNVYIYNDYRSYAFSVRGVFKK